PANHRTAASPRSERPAPAARSSASVTSESAGGTGADGAAVSSAVGGSVGWSIDVDGPARWSTNSPAPSAAVGTADAAVDQWWYWASATSRGRDSARRQSRGGGG